MKEPDNIAKVAALNLDIMGFIFYAKSPRYAAQLHPEEIPSHIERTGVFVNASITEVLHTADRYKLQHIQLHGNESPDFCSTIQQHGYSVWKAMGISDEKDFHVCTSYQNACDMLLFDTKSIKYGGTGQQFDWDILSHYIGTVPFLLSGGISENDVERIQAIHHPRFAGIDLNSRFESAPGIKNVDLLHQFINKIRL